MYAVSSLVGLSSTFPTDGATAKKLGTSKKQPTKIHVICTGEEVHVLTPRTLKTDVHKRGSGCLPGKIAGKIRNERRAKQEFVTWWRHLRCTRRRDVNDSTPICDMEYTRTGYASAARGTMSSSHLGHDGRFFTHFFYEAEGRACALMSRPSSTVVVGVIPGNAGFPQLSSVQPIFGTRVAP